jgi:hypothetical protein
VSGWLDLNDEIPTFVFSFSTSYITIYCVLQVYKRRPDTDTHGFLRSPREIRTIIKIIHTRTCLFGPRDCKTLLLLSHHRSYIRSRLESKHTFETPTVPPAPRLTTSSTLKTNDPGAGTEADPQLQSPNSMQVLILTAPHPCSGSGLHS